MHFDLDSPISNLNVHPFMHYFCTHSFKKSKFENYINLSWQFNIFQKTEAICGGIW